jgi:cyanobactin maturation PatA/PatG family protease
MSNWGTAYRAQGLLAPGENILGAMPGGGTVRKSGTSFATAVVAGLGALLFSIQRKNGNNLDAQMIRTAILLGATPCELGDEQLCQRFLVGRIDIRGSMTQLERLSSGKNLNARKRQLRLSSQDSELVSGPSSKDFQIQPKRGQHMQAETESVQIKSLGANVSVQETVNNNPTGEPVQPSLAKASAEPASADAISPSCGSEGKPGAAQGACGCGGKCGSTCAKPSLVYALGTLTYDFGTEARRDSLIQSGLKNPDDPTELVAFLAKHPESSTAVVWVLTQESTPIYAIQPIGPYASQTYEQLREFLRDQQAAGMVQISVPGYIFGKAALLSGQIVPTIAPELRGLNGWSVPKLVEAVVGTEPKNKDERSKHQERVNDITNFLERVYYEIRSLGVTPIERATNYAATNAFQVEQVFKKAIKADLKLDSIQAERSPICRPSSDCWDVKLTFFNPAKRFEQARHVYRFTVDVSDVIPVSVGSVRDWDVY